MENLIKLETIEENEQELTKQIFTKLQINILKKKLKKQPLNQNEKTYYYKYIKPKIKTILKLFNKEEIVIEGKEHIITERLEKSQKLIKKLEQKYKRKKIMITGSYLFNKKYQDIDIIMFSKYNKEDIKKGKLHITHLPETALNSLFYASTSKISIRNFNHQTNIKLKIEELLQTYEKFITLTLNKEENKQELRTLLLQTEYLAKEQILNPKQLYQLKETINSKNKIAIISRLVINSLVLTKQKETGEKIKKQIKNYEQLKKNYKTKNIELYLKTYQEAIEIGL